MNSFFTWLQETFDGALVGAHAQVDRTLFGFIPLDGSVTSIPAEPANCVWVLEDEWAERRPQCEGFISSILGRFERRVGARSCAVREVPPQEAKQFIEGFHIQGASRLGVVAFGLYEGAELIGLLSLGRHSRYVRPSRIVLDRLCFRRGVQVVGGASKLLKAAVLWSKKKDFKEILSFSDNRWTLGGLYQQLGFVLEKQMGPDYLYINSGGVRYSKQSQKKDLTECPESITELEWSRAHGLTRVYDLGKKRWTLNLWPDEHETLRDLNSRHCAEMHNKGVFKHSHIRGNFKSTKSTETPVYFGSSFELRCMFLLDQDPLVADYGRCRIFKGEEGWRNPDLFVRFTDGHSEIWEVKPQGLLHLEGVQAQLRDSAVYAKAQKVGFHVWSESDSGFANEHEIVTWARKYLKETQAEASFEEAHRSRRRVSRKRSYDKHVRNDRVDVWCKFCQTQHNVLRLSYDLNLSTHKEYVCRWQGSYIGGSKAKPMLRKPNPYASEDKKQCTMCKQVHPIAFFDRRAKSPDGRNTACKACIKIKNREQHSKATKSKRSAS